MRPEKILVIGAEAASNGLGLLPVNASAPVRTGVWTGLDSDI